MCKSSLVQIPVAKFGRRSRNVSFLVTDNLLLRCTGYFMLLTSVMCLNHILQSVCQHQVCGNMAAIWSNTMQLYGRDMHRYNMSVALLSGGKAAILMPDAIIPNPPALQQDDALVHMSQPPWSLASPAIHSNAQSRAHEQTASENNRLALKLWKPFGRR